MGSVVLHAGNKIEEIEKDMKAFEQVTDEFDRSKKTHVTEKGKQKKGREVASE